LLGHGYAIPTQTFTHSLAALQTYGLLIRVAKPSFTTKRYVQVLLNICLHIDILKELINNKIMYYILREKLWIQNIH
jgi:hypothetical protein